MRKGGGAVKGFGWERKCAGDLSLWFSGGKEDSSWFWRTSGSGARATVRRKKGKQTEGHAGDMVATCKEGEPLTDIFSFEFQFVKTMDILGVLYKKRHSRYDFLEHWLKCKRDADATGREPFMVTKINYGKPCVFVLHNCFNRLVNVGLHSKVLLDVTILEEEEHEVQVGKKYVKMVVQPQSVVGFLFDDFLQLDPIHVLQEFHCEGVNNGKETN